MNRTVLPSRSIWLWAGALIVLGAVLLLQTLGVAPPGVWAAVLPLWPVLLVAIGLRMWLGQRTTLVINFSALIVLVSICIALLRARAPSTALAQPLEQFVGTAQSASVRLNLQAARLQVAALDDDGRLLAGGAQRAPGETIEQTYVIDEGAGALVLTQRLDNLLAPFLAGDLAPHWDVRVTPALPLTLTVQARAGALTLDLASTQLTALDLQAGAADASVIFPARPATAHLRSIAGDLTLTLPSGVPVRLRVRARADRLQVPPFLVRQGDVFLSPGFAPAEPFLDLDVASSTGQITVD